MKGALNSAVWRGVFIKSWEAFDTYADEYDSWYEKYKPAYESELAALKEFLPKNPETLETLEIGTGTGRFAFSLGIKSGLDPSRPMAKIAKMRGIETILGVAEFLPFKKQKFDLILIVTALAFFKHPEQAIREMFRVLKPGGQLVTGILDRDSTLGQRIDSEREKSKFSASARFLSATEVLTYLAEAGFENLEVCQTLFMQPEKIRQIELPEKGHGKGGFVVISARKPYQEQWFKDSFRENSGF